MTLRWFLSSTSRLSCPAGLAPLGRWSSFCLPFTTLPLTPLHRFECHLFRVLPLRRLHLPLPLSSRFCQCGRPLGCFGHHRASCPRAALLGRRGCALESTVARVCREAVASVWANVFLRDLDLPIGAMDQRWIEVIAWWLRRSVLMVSHTVAVLSTTVLL